mgnify:CR=1 FL=1
MKKRSVLNNFWNRKFYYIVYNNIYNFIIIFYLIKKRLGMNLDVEVYKIE